jgi:hypothetical protein
MMSAVVLVVGSHAVSDASAPAYLVRDSDGAYGHVFTCRVSESI